VGEFWVGEFWVGEFWVGEFWVGESCGLLELKWGKSYIKNNNGCVSMGVHPRLGK